MFIWWNLECERIYFINIAPKRVRDFQIVCNLLRKYRKMHKFVTSQLAFRTPYEKNDHMYILTAWNSYDLWRMNLNFLTVPCALEIKLTIIKHITGNWKFDLGVILRPDKLSTKSFTKLWDTCTFKKHCPAKFIHTLQLIMSDLNYINFLYELFCTIHNIIPVALDSYKDLFFSF